MPYQEPIALPALASLIQDLQQRVTRLEARSRTLANGSMAIPDANGNNRIVIGNLGNGDYGIEVLDPSGRVEQLLPTISAFESAQLPITTPPYSPQTISGTPSVSAYLGPSADALITISTLITPGGVGNSVILYLTLDGTLVSNTGGLTQTTQDASASGTYQLSAILSAASMAQPTANATHSFGLEVASSGTSTAYIANTSLIVQPI